MALVKGSTEKKVTRNRTGVGSTQQDLVPADGWLNMKIVRSDGSEFTLRKGTPLYFEGGGDRVLEALVTSERNYRDKCIAAGIEYVPRTVKIEAHVQLTLPQEPLPDLFE